MKTQSIKKNYILNTAYQVLTLITPLITAPYISRILGPERVGIYSYTASVVAFFTMFAVLGTTTYGQRAIAQCRDDREKRSRTFWEIEAISIISTIICIVAWIALILVSTDYKLYFIILSVELLAAGFDIIWYYSGLERFDAIVARNVAIKFSSVLLLFVLVKNENDLWKYIAILSVSKFAGNISMWFPLRNTVDRVDLQALKIGPHFKQTLVYFIPTAAASIYSYLDKVMLEMFTDTTAENGFYEQANKIIKLCYTVTISLNTVMSARMSYLFSAERFDEIREKLENALAFMVTLSIPMVFGIAGIANNFVPWFFGDGYDKVIILLVIESSLVLILSMHNFLSAQYLIPSGQRVRSTTGVIVGAVTNFVFNLILIPKFQSVGAIVATLIGESSICICYFYMSKEYVPISMFLRYLPKQIVSAAAMLVIVLLIGQGHSGSILITIIQIAVGAAVYGVALLLLREKLVISMLKQMLGKLKRLH